MCMEIKGTGGGIRVCMEMERKGMCVWVWWVCAGACVCVLLTNECMCLCVFVCWRTRGRMCVIITWSLTVIFPVTSLHLEFAIYQISLWKKTKILQICSKWDRPESSAKGHSANILRPEMAVLCQTRDRQIIWWPMIVNNKQRYATVVDLHKASDSL